MSAAEPDPKPWVLIRKRKPVVRFLTRESGQSFFNALRFNSGPQSDGSLFGPKGEAWYCAGTRWSQWVRDDARRKRQPEDEPAPGEETAQ